MVTDCHSHLSFLSLERASQTIARGQSRGIERWALGGYDSNDWHMQLKLKKRFPQNILTVFGIHPWVVLSESEDDIERQFLELETLAPDCDWVGEIGLDFHRGAKNSASKQISAAKRLLEIAGEKPIVLHCVRAHHQMLELLASQKPPQTGFVHGFTGNVEVADAYRRRGFLVSIGPQVLDPKFTKLRETIKQLELDQFVIESDSPSYKGDQHDPVDMYFSVVREIAWLRKEDEQKVMGNVEINIQRWIH